MLYFRFIKNLIILLHEIYKIRFKNISKVKLHEKKKNRKIVDIVL